jgi:hypothetical protein
MIQEYLELASAVFELLRNSEDHRQRSWIAVRAVADEDAFGH